MVSRLFEKAPCYFEKVFRYYEKVPRYYEMASRLFEKVPRYFETFSRYYAPNFEEVDGAYWVRVVRASVRLSVQEPCMLGFWNFIYGFLMEKYLTHVFFFLSELSPFLELCTFEINPNEIWCIHILWTVHGRVLKFHIWIHHGKIADPYFFLVRVISLSGGMPLWKNQHKILSARYLKKKSI